MYLNSIVGFLVHGCTAVLLMCVILGACLTLQGRNLPIMRQEKNTAYECGFKPFDFAYYPFDVQFYRVGVLFLLFDVEILFFFPWVLNLYQINTTGHITMFLFIGLLFFGFIYEVKSEALAWYPQPWDNN